MRRESNLPEPPIALIDYLKNNLSENAELRRRAVFARSHEGNWMLLCCIVEAFPDFRRSVGRVDSRIYTEAMLYEDWLTPHSALAFVNEIQTRKVRLGGLTITRAAHNRWHSEMMPLRNSYMPRAGVLAGLNFEEARASLQVGPLLSARHPYYPDLAEAARDWLNIGNYHGDGDGRHQEILFLLPEARAFFLDALHDNGSLNVRVAGTYVADLDLRVKGAYWLNGNIHHFEQVVDNEQVNLAIPQNVDRLEYVLVGVDDLVYDFQQENKYSGPGPALRRLGRDSLVQNLWGQIASASAAGEGPESEFKLYIDPDEPLGAKEKKGKVRELLRTVAAFANTNGGRIFIGIDDLCRITGIGAQFKAWAKDCPWDEAVANYCGALLSKIRDHLVGYVSIVLTPVTVKDVTVVIVSVSSAKVKPVRLDDEHVVYVRAGSSNRQLPPEQWGNVVIPRPTNL